MKLSPILTLLLAASIAHAGIRGKAGPSSGRHAAGLTRGQAVQISRAMQNCKPSTIDTVRIDGLEKGKCKVTFSLPGGIQTCRFSGSQREEIKTSGATALQKWMGDPEVCSIKRN